MTTDIFNNDILSGDLNTSLVPELSQEDLSLNITPTDSSYTDPLTQELSLIEQEIVIDEIDIDNNSPNNNTSSFNNIAVANIDPFIAANTEEFQVNGIDVNDTSFAPPQSELQFQGGFGDYDGGDDVTLEIKDNDGNVIETFKLSGEGQASLYRDEEYQYVFFSGVDETTNVDINSTSNIKFGDYIGDSLEIQTTGSIEGGDIVLNDENTEADSGLTLRAGIDTENSVSNIFDGYTLIDFYDREMVDINNYGQIVGNDDFIGRDEFFFYNGQGLYYLPGYYSSRAFGINDYAQMVGEGLPTADDTKYRPLIAYSDGSVQEIQYVEGAGGRYNADQSADIIYTYEPYGSVRDVNNYLELASYQLNIPPENAPAELELTPFEDAYFLSPDGTQSVNIGYELLNSEDSRAFGINNLGNVVGINRETDRAFVFNREDNSVSNLGTLPGGDYSAAYAINDVGQVVGVSTSGSGSRAFIYENGIMKDMGVSYTGNAESRVGIDINNLGQAVITSAEGVPFVYQNGVVTNINDWLRPEVLDLGYTITEAKGINDRGQIIAQGTYDDSERGFLLNPTFQEVNRNINVGNISTFGETVLLEGAEVYLEGKSIVTQGGNITFDGKTKVNRNLIIDSSVTEDEVITNGGDITFTGTLDSISAGSGNLRLQTGTGNILFEDTVGGGATLRNINVQGADIVTANADITSDQVIRINSTGEIVTQNLTSENGRVVLSSQQKSISTLDITSGSDEGDHIILEAGDNVSTKNLSANELGTVRIASGKYLEQDSNIVGDITTESITGKRIRVESTGNFTATGDALAHDGNVVVDAKLDITTENITADNGNVRLISEEKSVTALDITSGSETEGGNIILEGVEGVRTDNLNARELGVVKIKSGKVTDTDTRPNGTDDTVEIGSIITDSITGKRVDASSTGGFTAIGDIIAYDGKITVTTHDDIQTKKIESVTSSINLVSTDGEVTVDGELISGKGGIGIIAKDDITTQKIDSANGVVGLSSFDGSVIVEDDITTIKGGVVIAGKAGVEVDDITTEVGEVSIGSSGDIDVNGRISTGTGYIDIKTNASISAQSATTNKGFVEIAAGGIATANIATGLGTSTLVSVANLDNEILIAGELDGNLSSTVTRPQDLSDEEAIIFTEFVKSTVYRARPLGEFVLGALYEWTFNNGAEIRGLMPGFLKLNEKEEARLNARLNQSQAFELGRLLGEGAAVAQGIYEFIAGSAAVGGGGGLCITGIGCFAGAPAIATGVVLQAHGGALAVNSASEFGERLGDILSPNRMASSGGADDVIGLSRETGISQGSIEKVYGDIDPSDIKLIGEKIDKNLVESLFGKGGDNATGSQLVKNVSETLKKVDNDNVAIDSIKSILRKNKNGKLSDSKTETAFSEAADFLGRYDKKVSGDFPTRFAEAQGKKGAIQARSEIQTAENILDGNSPFGGDVSKVDGIPTDTSNTGILTPDYRVIDTNGVSSLAEVKTPNGNFTRNNLQSNLTKAINQVKNFKNSDSTITGKAYITVDYSLKSPTNLSRGEIEQYSKFLIEQADGINSVKFVEISYKDPSNQLQKLLLKVQNGEIITLP